MSFHFLLQQRDLNAQREASGQGPHGCAVIHPRVKSAPSRGPLLCCPAKRRRERRRRTGLAEDARRETGC